MLLLQDFKGVIEMLSSKIEQVKHSKPWERDFLRRPGSTFKLNLYPKDISTLRRQIQCHQIALQSGWLTIQV